MFRVTKLASKSNQIPLLRRVWPWVAVGVFVFAAVACDRNTSPYAGDEAPREPDLSRIFPAADDPEPHDHQQVEAKPIAQQTSRVGSAPGPKISGEVRLGSVEAAPGATLFVIARKVGAAGGPPLAVVRVQNPSFPHSFELGQTNVMIPSLRFEGEMNVTARLDVDGNAMTRDESDLEGRAASVRSPGDSGVVIVLGPAGA